ncbi:hypothetical protein Hanom_Chr13g01204681 [Helianthus anomalus]
MKNKENRLKERALGSFHVKGLRFFFLPKLKPFTSRSLWFQFYCHFCLKMKSGHICLLKSCYLSFFLTGKMVILSMNIYIYI